MRVRKIKVFDMLAKCGTNCQRRKAKAINKYLRKERCRSKDQCHVKPLAGRRNFVSFFLSDEGQICHRTVGMPPRTESVFQNKQDQLDFTMIQIKAYPFPPKSMILNVLKVQLDQAENGIKFGRGCQATGFSRESLSKSRLRHQPISLSSPLTDLILTSQ